MNSCKKSDISNITFLINLISSTNHEEQVQECKKHTLVARKDEMLQKFQQKRILEKEKKKMVRSDEKKKKNETIWSQILFLEAL